MGFHERRDVTGMRSERERMLSLKLAKRSDDIQFKICFLL
jgi:hypothetical protein